MNWRHTGDMGRGHRDKISDILSDIGGHGRHGDKLGYIIGTHRGHRATIRATIRTTFWATLILVALVKTFKFFESCVYLF
jgi:hypothetical protein